MKAKEEKELLKGKKNALELLSADNTNAIVLCTNNGTAVIGTTEDICMLIGKLITVLKAKDFNGFELLKGTITFALLSDEEQIEFIKNEFKDILKKMDSIDAKKEEKEND